MSPLQVSIAIIEGCIRNLRESVPRLIDLVEEHGTPEDRAAYKSGVYATAVRLSVAVAELKEIEGQ